MGEHSGTGFVAGLEDVVAAETRLSGVDGEAGELTIAGFPVEELAGRASFEEVVYLLWNDELPDAVRLAEFREGDAVFVSGAAGAVGSLVGQFARLNGEALLLESRQQLGMDQVDLAQVGPGRIGGDPGAVAHGLAAMRIP